MTRPVVDALTTDGAIVTIRPVTELDRPDLADLFRRSSPRSLRLRFFTVPSDTALDAEVDRLTRPAAPDHATMVAVQAGRLVGVASYERVDTGRGAGAEFAIFVADHQQGSGIGTLLLEHLAGYARRHGVDELYGEVLADNARMLQVAGGVAATTRPDLEDHQTIRVSFPTRPDDTAMAAIDVRDRAAQRASLRPLLAPRSVAVVGAGETGYEVLSGLMESGYTGPVYPVAADLAEVAGIPAHSALSGLPEPAELVVAAVPAGLAAGVVADAATAGAKAVVVLSEGFAESGPTGAARQVELLQVARAGGIRLVGPNCLGVLNTDPAVRLNATVAPAPPHPGGLAVASQSGGVGIAVLEHAARYGCGVSSFVSLGNKADVSGNDLLAYWYDDPATTAVALYLESFGNPRKFARVARALARRKPVLAVFSGRSAAGRRAGAAHTAATASNAIAVDTLFAQAGVVRADHLGDLVNTARMLTDQPLPAGNRLAVVGTAGGAGVLAADAAEATGLVLPERVAGADNPWNLGADAPAELLRRSLERVADSGAVDAVLVLLAVTRRTDSAGLLAVVGQVADARPALPVAAVVLGPHQQTTAGARRVPVYDLPEPAVRAIGHAAWYAAWRREPLGRRPDLPDVDTAGARADLRTWLARSAGLQPPHHTARLLGRYGIPVSGPAEPAAENPPGTPDGGGRRTEPGAEPVRLLAGIAHDRHFGSLVMLGLAGPFPDLLGERAYRLVPLTDLDAGRMWRSLPAAPLRAGARDGGPPVDTSGLERLLLRLGRLAEDLPEVAELELEVSADPDGVLVTSALSRLAETGPEPDPLLRRLR